MNQLTQYLIADFLTLLFAAVGFYTWTRVQVAGIKKDLHYFREIYNREKQSTTEHIERLYDRLSEICKGLSEIKSDLKVLKFQAGIDKDKHV